MWNLRNNYKHSLLTMSCLSIGPDDTGLATIHNLLLEKFFTKAPIKIYDANETIDC